MRQTYVAIDIGASSGRLMKSQLTADNNMTLEEVHRFKNGFEKQGDVDCWQIEYLIQEILVGLEKLKQAGTTHCYVGIDTWAVDYCLINQAGERVGDPVAYRDHRTAHAVADFSQQMPLETLYEKTGIQLQPFNTLFQLWVEDKEKLAAADKLLLIPDYLGYVFTGKAVCEKTNASTTQLLHAGTQEWDAELLALLGISEELFPPLVDAGTVLGELRHEQFPTFDLPQATFISVASHDTASAVLGTPASGTDWAYISSGTWSLLGVETTVANVTKQAFSENYTNEWGAHNTIRFLKNIMGMWLIQEVARNQQYQYSYPQLAELAAETAPFQQFIDVNDARFLNPANMIEELQAYCRETKQPVPETPGELARCIYDNLALCYGAELRSLERLTGTHQQIDKLYIVGGGSNNQFLNQLTADVSGLPVQAGPGEATAIGNVLMQMLATNAFDNLAAGRQAIKESFDCQLYHPRPIDATIHDHYQTFLEGVKQ